MISLEQLKIRLKEFKFGKYIAIDELLRIVDDMIEKSLEDKLTLEKRAELTEKKKERLWKQLKNV